SSESANSASQAISVRMRCRPGSRSTLASAASQKTYSSGPQRARNARRWVTSATGADGVAILPLPACGAGEQALRAQDQNDDHDGVDHEGPEFRDVILAGNVGDADHQRGGERTGDAGGTADRYHDQEIDHVFEREGRIESENLRAQRAAEPGQAGTYGEGQGEHGVDVDAQSAGDARIVDR